MHMHLLVIQNQKTSRKPLGASIDLGTRAAYHRSPLGADLTDR